MIDPLHPSHLGEALTRELNPRQVEAVTYPAEPLLVIAGAGSGKTRVRSQLLRAGIGVPAHNRRRMRRLSMIALIGSVALAPFAHAAEDKPAPEVTLSVIGTSDLHGHIAALPWLAGYLDNLRAVRAPGAVIVLDAGDMFQGTLESSLVEGASVVRAYNAIGYAAAAIGNHEFDFGPAGPAPSPVAPSDDPRGALKARASEAHFPFLAANLVDKKTGRPVDWPNVKPSTIIDAAGIKVGVVGVITAATSRSALPANVAGLEFLPLADTIAREARKLRGQGAKVVIAVTHEGGACTSFADPDKLDSCDARSEIFAIARDLPKHSVDAIVAGHTHQGLAQKVAGVPIIQAYANGRAFGRVDLTVSRATGKVIATHLEAPHDLCPGSTPDHCQPGDYEGKSVKASDKLIALNAAAFAQAKSKDDGRLGVEVSKPMPHNRARETALGNLLVDMMRVARPGHDVAMLNGGGIRAGLPAGALTYERLCATFPFDNTFAEMRLSAGEFRRLLTRGLARSGSLVALSGLRVLARCKDKVLDVSLVRPDGTTVRDDETLALLTTNFLATGGDGFFAGSAIPFEIGPPMRDALAGALSRWGGKLDPDDPALFDPKHPRFDLPAPVPIDCAQ